MAQNTRYDILFEPVAIGPVTAKNRFYQVPHCSGTGHLRPQAHAAMRAMKAEGGWGVVCNEETEIHPSSDLSPYVENRLWDERDIPALRLMTDAVHEHGSLAGIELVHNGNHTYNLFSRAPALAVNDMSVSFGWPKQARAMDKSDIKELRRWHKQAALRSKEAGFDIVYVYAGHGMTLAQQFLLPEYNNRTDEYGGSLENRTRLIRELLEDTKEAVGDSCGVAFRFAVDELKGADGMQAEEEGRAVVELLAELPDLWDVNVSDWSNDSSTSRFNLEEGYQTQYTEFVKTVTSKPVVAVGRFTSPDMMVSLVKRKAVDFIGAARPSIADPFLPKKIEEDRIEEIRECIGCNICVSCDGMSIPIRCTQNPTMGEEWRRGWHPEFIRPKQSEQSALVVGSGPAGLECSMQLARRGYHVTLAEAADTLGGRVSAESNLKGLSAWSRVRDYRQQDLQQRGNVDIFTGSELSAEQVVELGIQNVFLATGAVWRRDGVGRSSRKPLPGVESAKVFTMEDIVSGVQMPSGPIVIYDDEQGYLGGVLADHLSSAGHEVIIVTPGSVVSAWTAYTLEQERIQTLLLKQGVKIIANHSISSVSDDNVTVSCVFTGKKMEIPCAGLLLVTERTRRTELYQSLIALKESGNKEAQPFNFELIGDALAPGLIADAVYSGHLAAQNFEEDPAEIERALFQRELPSLSIER